MPRSYPVRTPFLVTPLLALAVTLVVALLAVATGAPRAEAASLQRVSSFGTNPGGLGMYTYLPDDLPSGAPVVILLHGCSQDAATYHDNSGWDRVARERGVALVYAQQPSGNNASSCFNWFQPGDTARGSGEAASIRQMVDYAADTLGATGPAYVSGLSAGGAMASEVLSAYPDIFAGGSVVAGLPTGCADSMLAATTCMSGGEQRSAEQWGEEVRDKNPGYTGPWPRVEIWHGSADYVVDTANAEASRAQWVNVHGASPTPGRTEQRPSGTVTEYYEADGEAVVALSTVAGMGHGTPVDPSAGCGSAGAYFLDTLCSAAYTADFLGIDTDVPTPTPTPTATASPSPTPSPTPTAQPGTCVTDDNYGHVTAGRARHHLGHAYTVGGDDDLGLFNTWVVTSVHESAPGHWIEVSGC
ncbi:extracellular catalytic domain type 1 short-chain-length polyhydroxyalkanoate depolymerase [Salinactinospora qingdaonensis]|uniref:PHB depolymerase family esterase n=1 Tax=Salinactinospora qingdaonensis TaxID=702744 RepID=A0ABP7FNA2_9ACTN